MLDRTLVTPYDNPPDDGTYAEYPKYACPMCGNLLEDDDTIYVVKGRVVGCYGCIEELQACEL